MQAKLDKDRQAAPLQPLESPSSLSDPAVVCAAKKEPVKLLDRDGALAAITQAEAAKKWSLVLQVGEPSDKLAPP